MEYTATRALVTDFIDRVDAGEVPTELHRYILNNLGSSDVGTPPNAFNAWLRRLLLGSSPEDSEPTELRPFDDAEFFRQHRITSVHVRGPGRLERQVLPSGGSFGLFAIGRDHFHYLTRRRRNVEALLRQEARPLDDAKPLPLATFLVEALGPRSNSRHDIVGSAQELSDYQPLAGVGERYEVDPRELRSVGEDILPPKIEARNDGWLVSFCSVYGWMDRKNTLLHTQYSIGRATYSISADSRVLSRKIFRRTPQLRY